MAQARAFHEKVRHGRLWHFEISSPTLGGWIDYKSVGVWVLSPIVTLTSPFKIIIQMHDIHSVSF